MLNIFSLSKGRVHLYYKNISTLYLLNIQKSHQ
ncbi:hypothetical protein ECN1_2482, partial [Escherichia coli N1]